MSEKAEKAAPFSVWAVESIVRFKEGRGAQGSQWQWSGRGCTLLLERPVSPLAQSAIDEVDYDEAERVAFALCESAPNVTDAKTVRGLASDLEFLLVGSTAGSFSSTIGELPEELEHFIPARSAWALAASEKMLARAIEKGIAEPGALCRLVDVNEPEASGLRAFIAECEAKHERRELAAVAEASEREAARSKGDGQELERSCANAAARSARGARSL
jgi:hypothetical protein